MVTQNIVDIQVDQAIFASSDRGQVRGYQLVAQSAGIDAQAALELTRWAPTQLPSDASERGIISSWQLDSNRTVVARTIYGGPEYSNRGGIQVVTLFLVLRAEQIEAYQYDAIAVARTAIALGYLRLPLDIGRHYLSPVPLPDQPLVRSLSQRGKAASHYPVEGLIDEATKLIGRFHRIAITGLSDPFDAVELLISKLSAEQRKRFSFTTGLSPSIRRPVQAHFYRYPEAIRRQALESQDVIYLSTVPRSD